MRGIARNVCTVMVTHNSSVYFHLMKICVAFVAIRYFFGFPLFLFLIEFHFSETNKMGRSREKSLFS